MSQNDPQAQETGGKEKKGRKGFGITFKVSAKGAVSVYGLGRFPVTLYREQWVRLLERTGELEQFMEEHASELKSKGGTEEGAPAERGPETVPAEAGDVEQAVTSEEAGATYPPDAPSDPST